jgi:3-hydroxypropanoate dehydrogenase
MDQFLKKILLDARTHYSWQNKTVEDAVLESIYDAAKMGPTSANTSPLRIVFVKSQEAKEKLKPTLLPTNVEKTMTAPVTAIFAQDMEFYNSLPYLFPHNLEAKSWFVGSKELIEKTAFRNSTLQAAYFIIAARAYGLDCGPMSGFDNEKVDEIFFKDTPYKSNFICNLGYGEADKLYPRLPRFEFKQACSII